MRATPSTLAFLLCLKPLRESHPRKSFDKLVIGVVSNSDDRVPEILTSFGLNVSPLRYGFPADRTKLANNVYDIDFICMSYDVGFEKPDHRIFSAAEKMLEEIVAIRDSGTPAKKGLLGWDKICVGDDYYKDVVGALNAKWNSVLLVGDEGRLPKDLLEAEQGAAQENSTRSQSSRVDSITSLAEWLMKLNSGSGVRL